MVAHKTTVAFGIFAGGFVALAIIYFGFLAKEPEDVIEKPISKVLRFSYTLTNQSSDFIKSAEFISHIPAEIAGKQIIENIKASHDYQLIDHGGVHQSIKFDVKNLPPYGSRIVSVTFKLLMSSTPQRDELDKDTYLKHEKYIERNSDPVTSLAETLGKQSDAVHAVYRWLGNNLRDAGYVAESKGARFAIEQGWGDCTEHMFAFVALARAMGIPARGVAGFVVEGDAEIADSSSYHNWAEFYDGEKWILVDTQKQVMDQDYQNYIAYRIIGGDLPEQASTSRFLSVDKRISIKI